MTATFAAGDLGGMTLVPGVYNSPTTLALTGALTLDGQGDPSAVFIFQAGSALTTASGSSVVLIGGAQACNVYWQVGSSATLGTGSTFVGTVFAGAAITATTGATVQGRLLARVEAVTLDTNTITTPVCAPVVPPVAPPTTTPSGPSSGTNPELPATGSALLWEAVAGVLAVVVGGGMMRAGRPRGKHFQRRTVTRPRGTPSAALG